MTAELDESQYPPQSVHGYSARQLIDSGVAFFVARIDGRAAGCGGVEIVDDPGDAAYGKDPESRYFERRGGTDSGLS